MILIICYLDCLGKIWIELEPTTLVCLTHFFAQTSSTRVTVALPLSCQHLFSTYLFRFSFHLFTSFV